MLIVATDAGNTPAVHLDTTDTTVHPRMAHLNNDRVEAAYRRTDLFEKRRDLMDAWAA